MSALQLWLYHVIDILNISQTIADDTDLIPPPKPVAEVCLRHLDQRDVITMNIIDRVMFLLRSLMKSVAYCVTRIWHMLGVLILFMWVHWCQKALGRIWLLWRLRPLWLLRPLCPCATLMTFTTFTTHSVIQGQFPPPRQNQKFSFSSPKNCGEKCALQRKTSVPPPKSTFWQILISPQNFGVKSYYVLYAKIVK